jgi:hypothetical protein
MFVLDRHQHLHAHQRKQAAQTGRGIFLGAWSIRSRSRRAPHAPERDRVFLVHGTVVGWRAVQKARPSDRGRVFLVQGHLGERMMVGGYSLKRTTRDPRFTSAYLRRSRDDVQTHRERPLRNVSTRADSVGGSGCGGVGGPATCTGLPTRFQRQNEANTGNRSSAADHPARPPPKRPPSRLSHEATIIRRGRADGRPAPRWIDLILPPMASG